MNKPIKKQEQMKPRSIYILLALTLISAIVVVYCAFIRITDYNTQISSETKDRGALWAGQ